VYFFVGFMCDVQGKRHIVKNSPRVHKVKVLEDHADPLAFKAQLGIGKMGDVDPVDLYLAAAWPFEQVYGPKQGAFSGSA